MHSNNGSCLGCAKIFNKYPGFYEPLKDWFFKIQSINQNFHISCAGRGKIDQEVCFSRGASNAHWLESAHNFNIGIDTFFMIDGQYILNSSLYSNITQNLDPTIDWYGNIGAVYKELPHFEIIGWEKLSASGLLKPVE